MKQLFKPDPKAKKETRAHHEKPTPAPQETND